MLRKLLAICAAISLLSLATGARAQDPVARSTFRGWLNEVSNHGRWGSDDELGTLNLITPEIRSAAAMLARDGMSISLSHDLVAGPNPNAFSPLEIDHTVAPLPGGAIGAMDKIHLLYHGYSYSHMDALSHFGVDSTFFNGSSTDILSADGASRLSISAMKNGIVSRGVLVDVPLLRGVEHLEPGDVITVQDIAAWEARTGIRVTQGDVLLIRTGRWHREETVGQWALGEFAAGLHPSAATWLHDRGVAAIGSDGPNDRNPSLVEGTPFPLHQLVIAMMGMPVFDNLDLQELASTASDKSRWTFMFVAAPLRIQGASGSPINPLAIF